jgi:hypothetical protein
MKEVELFEAPSANDVNIMSRPLAMTSNSPISFCKVTTFFQDGKKKTLETASVSENQKHRRTVVSSVKETRRKKGVGGRSLFR